MKNIFQSPYSTNKEPNFSTWKLEFTAWNPVLNPRLSLITLHKKLISGRKGRNTHLLFLSSFDFSFVVNGMWGSWSSWSACNKTCGQGTRERKRLCDNPKPDFSGNKCLGSDIQTENCSALLSCPTPSECVCKLPFRPFRLRRLTSVPALPARPKSRVELN